MPDRLIRTADGLLGGLLVINGLYLASLGVSWFYQPTKNRVAGVEWINDSILPITTLSWEHVAWFWILGGTLSLLGGVHSKRRGWERMGVVAAVMTPLIVSAVFIGAFIDNSAPFGVAAALSYTYAGAIPLWFIHRERRSAEARGVVAHG